MVDFEQVNSAAIEEFGEVISYVPAGGDPVELRGIFGEPALPLPVAPGVIAVVRVRTLDVPGSPEGRNGDVVIYGGREYFVLTVEADEGGILTLGLNARNR